MNTAKNGRKRKWKRLWGCGKERVKRVAARGEWRVGEWSVVSDWGEGVVLIGASSEHG